MKPVNFELGIFLIAVSIAVAPSFGFAQETRVERIARAAGTLLAANEHLKFFVSTKCGYAIKVPVQTTSTILESIVIPGFPVEHRGELRSEFSKLLPTIQKQSQQQVPELIARAIRITDEKTGCGYVAGVLATTFERTKANFDESRVSAR